MEGLTAKVFRTYNASRTLQEQLDLLTVRKCHNRFASQLCRFHNYFEVRVIVPPILSYSRRPTSSEDLGVQPSQPLGRRPLQPSARCAEDVREADGESPEQGSSARLPH